jgi:histone arginine demethylase JMJD6
MSLDATLSLTRNFLPPCALARVAKPLAAYLQRRDTCESLLGRTLRASDNLLKFCVHGGSLPMHAVKDVLNPHKQTRTPETP